MLDRSEVLPHLIARHVAEVPDRVAMLDVDGGRATYRQLQDTYRTWSDALRRVGVQPGDHVATMLPNSFVAYEAWLGVAWLRAVEVPINNAYLGDMLRYLLNDSQAEVLVIARRFVDRLAEVAADLDYLRTVVVPDAEPGDDITLPFEVLTGERFFEGALPADDLPGPAHHDTCALVYTSGTTGPSKGVLVPWAELNEFARMPPEGMIDDDGAYYTVYPAFHVSGKSSLYMSSRYRGHIVIRETFSLTDFWNDIRSFDVHAAGLVGPMAALLMLAPPDPSDADNPLERVYMGPLIPQVEEFKERFGLQVGSGFGMTEIGVPLATDGFRLANSTSCGRVRPGYPGYQVRIVDDFDEEVPAGTVGELVVRADEPWVITPGYLNQPERTAAAWRNGWFHTGDAFRVDEDGNHYFVDRLKDAIRRRGENISSFEVEAAVNQHPSVQESAAVGVPSELGEDDIKVFVVPVAGQDLDPVALLDFLEPRMPRHMLPRYVQVLDALPKTDATFRTKKVELRSIASSDTTHDREAIPR
ncbi:MAG: AMP-binding protein [Actinomycetota bacterium]|nr:AMP-binding protein [Actinomycetota bacterium]